MKRVQDLAPTPTELDRRGATRAERTGEVKNLKGWDLNKKQLGF